MMRTKMVERADDELSGLYRREWAPLTRLAVVLVGSRPLAEEIVQDAFVALQSRWDRVDNPGGYLRWFPVIAAACVALLVAGAAIVALAPSVASSSVVPVVPGPVNTVVDTTLVPVSTTATISITATTATTATTVTLVLDTSVAPAVAACTATALHAVADPLGDSLMSNTRLIVRVTNVGTAACTMPTTPPTLIGVDADRARTSFVSGGDDTYFGSPTPLTEPLSVGGVAVLWVGGGQPGVCDPLDATQTWDSMQLELPDGSDISFTTPFDTKCGVSVTPFGTPPPRTP